MCHHKVLLKYVNKPINISLSLFHKEKITDWERLQTRLLLPGPHIPYISFSSVIPEGCSGIRDVLPIRI